MRRGAHERIAKKINDAWGIEVTIPQFKTWIRKRADRMKGRKPVTTTAEHLKEYEDVVNTLKTNQKGCTKQPLRKSLRKHEHRYIEQKKSS